MKRVMIRLGLSLMVAVGWWVQKVPAQTPATEAPPVAIEAARPAPVLTPIDSSRCPRG